MTATSSAPYPFGFIGDGLTRCAALALPCSQVRALLPPGLELGEQNLTPRGTHPVIFLFHRFFHCQYSFPTPLRPMSFHEQTAGIPFTYTRAGNGAPGGLGPYYFMPKLYLDDWWVWMNGRFLWGFDKEMAAVTETENRYTVMSPAGRPLVSLEWNGEAEFRSAAFGYGNFEPVRQMLSQPLVTSFPAAAGPFAALTDFDRRWPLGTVRPVSAVLQVEPGYMPGFDGGQYNATGPGSDSRVIGSYELSAPWWLSLPYAPPAAIAAG
jgi:hypothetical protein